MSLENVKEILLKANTDPNARKLLFENPEEVFKNYNLTEEEKQSLRGLKEDQLSRLSEEMESEGDSVVSDIRI